MSEGRVRASGVAKKLVNLLVLLMMLVVLVMLVNALLVRASLKVVASAGLGASGEAHVIPTDYIVVEEAVPVRLKGFVED